MADLRRDPYAWADRVPFRVELKDAARLREFNEFLEREGLAWREEWTFVDCYKRFGIPQTIQTGARVKRDAKWDFAQLYPKKSGKTRLIDSLSVARMMKNPDLSSWRFKKDLDSETELGEVTREYNNYRHASKKMLEYFTCRLSTLTFPSEKDMKEFLTKQKLCQRKLFKLLEQGVVLTDETDIGIATETTYKAIIRAMARAYFEQTARFGKLEYTERDMRAFLAELDKQDHEEVEIEVDRIIKYEDDSIHLGDHDPFEQTSNS